MQIYGEKTQGYDAQGRAAGDRVSQRQQDELVPKATGRGEVSPLRGGRAVEERFKLVERFKAIIWENTQNEGGLWRG